MKTETMIRFYAVILLLSFITLTVKYFNLKNEYDLYQKENLGISSGDIAKANTIDSLQKRCDSLYNELFPTQVELGRYQVAYEIFLERNPKAAKQYGTIISEETE